MTPHSRDDADAHTRLMRELLVERFATLTPEHRQTRAELEDAKALRLVADNDERLADSRKAAT